MDPSRQWIIPTVVLCSFGFIKELRPVEPFLTPFLRQKNLTEAEIESQVYPFWTYSYMLSLVFVFLVTDLVRYKPVIVLEGVMLVGTGCLMIWGDTLSLMKVMQCVYGLATAADIGYYAYIYAVVPKEKYQQVSSYTRSAYLVGRFTSGVIGQILISFKLLDYAGLNIFGTVSVSIATVVSLFLPAARKSIFFHRRLSEEEENKSEEYEPSGHGESSHIASVRKDLYDQSPPGSQSANLESNQENKNSNNTFELCCMAEDPSSVQESKRTRNRYLEDFKSLWSQFKLCYSDPHLVQWSLWWAIATCGFFQVVNYAQNLWDLIYFKNGDEDLPTSLYYGAVEAINTLSGALAAFLIMFPKTDWEKFGELLMGLISLLDAAFLIIMGLTTNIWIAYTGYILFCVSYQLMITIATFQIAKTVTIERYALVFGWNTFIALVLESLLTFIVVDRRVLNSPADQQFIIYGCFFGLLALAFVAKVAFVLIRKTRRSFECATAVGS